MTQALARPVATQAEQVFSDWLQSIAPTESLLRSSPARDQPRPPISATSTVPVTDSVM